MTNPTPPTGYSTLTTSLGFKQSSAQTEEVFIVCNRCGCPVVNQSTPISAHTTFHQNMGLLNINLGLKT